MSVSRQFYESCYDLLHATGNFAHNPGEKLTFVNYFLETPSYQTREWRFSGHLGFGGKFWRNAGQHYVTCYREDETPERRTMIDNLNQEIANLARPDTLYISY